MSIKVRHDGNATPTTFASKAGGEGKRAQQDAAHLSSVMQSAATASNQQLRGASAPSASPGHSSAPTIHAPTGSAPQPPTPINPLATSGVARSTGGASVLPTSASQGRVGTAVQPSRTTVRSGSESAQDQIAQLQLQRMREGLDDDRVIETTERFGEHSQDAVWDPTNGGRWVRPWRPGEKEAEGLLRTLGVKGDYETALKEAEMVYGTGSYLQRKLADTASEPNVNQLKKQYDQMLQTAKSALPGRGRVVSGYTPLQQEGGKIVPTKNPGNPPDMNAIYDSGHKYYGDDGSGGDYDEIEESDIGSFRDLW